MKISIHNKRQIFVEIFHFLMCRKMFHFTMNIEFDVHWDFLNLCFIKLFQNSAISFHYETYKHFMKINNN